MARKSGASGLSSVAGSVLAPLVIVLELTISAEAKLSITMMKGCNRMRNTGSFSDSKRILLEKYLRGESSQSTLPVSNSAQNDTEVEVTSPHENVIAIQSGESKIPFFFLQGDWINGAYWCFPLAHELETDQPFYALEPCRFENLEALPTFEEIAATHLKSLYAIQPEGPYLLGGFCNGGLLAYEMARQLHAQGQKVNLLLLIDPMGLVYSAHDRLMHYIVRGLVSLMRLSQKKQLAYFVWLRHLYRYLQHEYRYIRFPRYRRLKSELKPWQVNMNGGILLTLKSLHELWLDQESERLQSGELYKPTSGQHTGRFVFPKLDAVFPEPIFPTAQTISQDYPAIYDWIAMHYHPLNLYPGKVTFIWDTGDAIRSSGWRKVTEACETEIHIITGKQSSWKTKNLHVLAEFLRMCLSKVQLNAEP